MTTFSCQYSPKLSSAKLRGTQTCFDTVCGSLGELLRKSRHQLKNFKSFENFIGVLVKLEQRQPISNLVVKQFKGNNT